MSCSGLSASVLLVCVVGCLGIVLALLLPLLTPSRRFLAVIIHPAPADMDEKAPLLRPLIRRSSDNGSIEVRWQVLLGLVVSAALITLGINIHHAARPGQEAWDVGTGAQGVTFSWTAITPSRILEWHTCFNAKYDCARLDVPLDWLDPTDQDRVVLAVVRLRAIATTDKTAYKGPIFMNPGGPGGSGIWALKDHGAQLQAIVGAANYDIVTFDPRGIGASVPRIECWDSRQKRHDWAMQAPPVIDAHAGGLYDAWARAAAASRVCEQAHNDSGLLRHIGTASHARDMLAILDQMGEDKLQYWGFSYGTTLGGVFAALYPDRVGRLVSDGNVDYREWFNNAHINSVRDADAVMDAFYTLCHKVGPLKCAFHGPSPENIRERHLAILERLRVEPVIHMPADNSGAALPELITFSKLRRLAATALYRPNFYFTHLAEILAGLEHGDGTAYYALVTRFGLPFSDVCTVEAPPPTEPLAEDGEGNDDAFATILCADGEPLPRDPRDFQAYVDEMESLSTASGAIVVQDRVACAGRAVRPKWDFKGPFEAETSFPILYIANMADNITPLAAARNNSVGFKGSVVLVQNSYGHTSLAAPSVCTAKVVREYFQQGVLPEAGTRCDADLLPFDITGSDTASGDKQLAAAARELSAKANWGVS